MTALDHNSLSSRFNVSPETEIFCSQATNPPAITMCLIKKKTHLKLSPTIGVVLKSQFHCPYTSAKPQQVCAQLKDSMPNTHHTQEGGKPNGGRRESDGRLSKAV